LSKARLDALVEEATTDAYNEGEQIVGFLTLIDGSLATFTSHAQAFVSEPMALSNDPIVLKACVLGPNGPRFKVKAVQEIVVSILYGEDCA
jgi:hypothetical protein